jgi:hypothetical protein
MDIDRSPIAHEGGVRRFEGCVHNTWVRLLLDTGEPNVTGFDDRWAESRFVEVRARSLGEAVTLLQRDYPEGAGFEISAIVELSDEAS